MTDMLKHLTILLSLVLTVPCMGQSAIVGTTTNPLRSNSDQAEILDKIFKSYDIYTMDISKDDILIDSNNSRLNLELGQRKFDLNLYPQNLAVSLKSNKELPHLLGGSLASGGSVSLTINDDFIYGYIKSNESNIFIEPLHYFMPDADKNLYIVYNVNQVREDKYHTCGASETHEKEQEFSPLRSITECKVIKLGIANTYDMITKYTNVTGVTNHNLGVLNNVQTNYRSEFDKNIEFDVVAHFFPTSSSQDPITPNTSSSDANVMLSRFRDWAQGPGNAGGGNSGGATGGFGADYNMASLWTDRNIQFGGNGGVVGLAYTPGWHNLLEDYTASAPSLMSLVTHEKGHNFGASHDAANTNYIMAPSVTLTPNWSSVSQTDINNRINGQTYLDNCSDLGAPTANFFQEAIAVCSGSTVNFEDQSEYGATRDWEFFGGSPTTSTDEKPSATYNTSGMYAVKLTSYNSAGSDEYFGYVDIESAPPTPCTPSGGNGGTGGITLVSLANLNYSSNTDGLYEDNACDNVASLESDTAYDLVVGVSGVTRLRYYIDYNDDGDFDDAGEASSLYSFSGNGNLGLTLTTPVSPITESI